MTDPAAPHTARRATRELTAAVLTVAAGGALGAAARYGVSLLWPAAPAAFPWAVLGLNTAGCAVIGAVMALLAATPAAHPLLGPFLTTGVLGGFTTFSGYAGGIRLLTTEGHLHLALLYLAATPLAAVLAVWCTAVVARRLITAARARPSRAPDRETTGSAPPRRAWRSPGPVRRSAAPGNSSKAPGEGA